MKISNKYIEIKLMKNGKKVSSKRFVNRILDSYLDFMCYKITPLPDRGTLFPDFASSDFQQTPFVYLKFGATQTITDSSTTMTYDIKQEYNSSVTTKVQTANTVNITTVYVVDTSSYSTDLYGIGFGQDQAFVTDWLLAFLDIEDAGVNGTYIDEMQIVRVDEFEADGTLIEGSGSFDYDKGPFHLNYFEDFGVGFDRWSFLDSIYFSDSTTATTEDESYDIITDLTITNPSTGQLTFSGFNNWSYDSGATPNQYQTTGFKYQIQTYDGSTLADESTYVFYKDLGVNTDDGGTVTVTYKFERKN